MFYFSVQLWLITAEAAVWIHHDDMLEFQRPAPQVARPQRQAAVHIGVTRSFGTLPLVPVITIQRVTCHRISEALMLDFTDTGKVSVRRCDNMKLGRQQFWGFQYRMSQISLCGYIHIHRETLRYLQPTTSRKCQLEVQKLTQQPIETWTNETTWLPTYEFVSRLNNRPCMKKNWPAPLHKMNLDLPLPMWILTSQNWLYFILYRSQNLLI